MAGTTDDASAGVARAVTYRLYPSKHQLVALDELRVWQQRLYNAALDERRGAWTWERRSVTKFDQYKGLTGLQREPGWEWLGKFGIGVARGTLTRLDEAFQHFFRRVKAGETPGFPRFKGIGSWDSVQWEGTTGWKLELSKGSGYGKLYLQGIGHIRVKLHHLYAGAEPRKIVVRRRGAGKRQRWEVTVFWRNVTVERPNPTGLTAGVDVGVAVLAAVASSDGNVELLPNPKHLEHAARRLERAQQALAKTRKVRRPDGGGRRARARDRVRREHQRVANLRRDHAHQLSRRLADQYDSVFFEQLAIDRMTRSAAGTIDNPGSNVAAKAGLNRAILDAGWGQLGRMTTYKAESAGRTVVRVKAAHTSQTCAACWHTAAENRVTRDTFTCTACGHTDHADINAARVILEVGLGRNIVRPRKRAHTRPGSGHPPVTVGREAA